MKKKVVIAHGYWGRGGAEIASMQLIEAIKDKFEVHLLTRGGWDLKELNTAAGTSISSSDVTLVKLPFAQILKQTFAGDIWHAFFLRYCRRIAPKYDIRVTASRIIGWGQPAVHFLSDVVWNEELERINEIELIKPKGLKKVSAFIGDILAGKAKYQLHNDDVFVANSTWTAKLSSPYTTNEPIVITPPVDQVFDQVPWHSRLNHFASFGRISPEKKIEDSIAIIDQVRKNDYEVKLTIFGQFGNDDYSKKIKNLIKDKQWIDAPGPIYGDKVTNRLPQYKYGINTCLREAFGISTAEMLKAGLITFIPQQGAQYEIVGNELLTFKNVDDAIEKIIEILKSEELRKRSLDIIDNKKKDFSNAKFKNEVLKIFKSL